MIMYDKYMIRFLPFIIIPVLILGGLGYFRFVYLPQQSLQKSQTETVTEGPIEVPSTLPEATEQQKVANLETSVDTLVKELNALKLNKTTTTDATRLNNAEAAIIELKARVSALENASPAPAASSSKSNVYIPLGSGAGPWTNQDWYTVTDYLINLDPANFPGYTGMYLEVTFRLVESAGTGSVRLYNTTDSSATSSQMDTTSTSYGLSSSASFKLPAGSKNYTLQVKSTSGKELFIQTARIRVSF